MYLSIRSFLKQPISKSERTKRIKQNEAEKLYEDDDFFVIYPKTRLANCLYGSNTQCRTASKKFNNFSSCNSLGKLYIIIDKRSGKKFQFLSNSNTMEIYPLLSVN